MGVRELVTYEIRMGGELADNAAHAAREVRGLEDASRDADRAVDSLGRGGEKIAAMIGGPLGDLADLAFDVGGAIGSAEAAIGAAGVAAGISTIAVVGLAVGLVGVASATADAYDRLVELRLEALIRPEDAEGVHLYRQATSDLSIALDLLAVSAGAGPTAGVAQLTTALTGGIVALQEGSAWALAFGAALTDGLFAALTPEDSALVDGLARAVDRMGEAWDRAYGYAEPWLSLGAELGGSLSELAQGVLLGPVAILDRLVAKGQEFGAVVESAQAAADAVAPTAGEPEAPAEFVGPPLPTSRPAPARPAAPPRAPAPSQPTPVKVVAIEDWPLGDAIVREAQETTRAIRDSADDAGEAGDAAVAALEELQRQLYAATVGRDSADLFGGPTSVDVAGQEIAGLREQLPGILTEAGTRALGPLGAQLVPLAQIPSLITASLGVYQSLTQTFEDLPETIGTVFREQLPELIELAATLPQVVVEGLGRLPGEIVSSLPEILPALASAVAQGVWYLFGGLTVDLFRSLADVLFDGLGTKIVDGFKEAVTDLVGRITAPFEDKEGRFLGTNLNAAKGAVSVFGLEIPRFASGTPMIEREGLSFLDVGERVLTAKENAERGRGGGGGGVSIQIGAVHGVQDARAFLRELREILGTTGGLGESLDAYA